MKKENYIICTHNDLDGFCCGAMLLNFFPKAHVLFAISRTLPKSINYIKDFLRFTRPNHLIICDISPKEVSVSKIERKLTDFREHFELLVTWFDHHDWPSNATNLKDVTILCNKNKDSSAKLVQEFFAPNDINDHAKLAEPHYLAVIEDERYWKTVIKNVSKLPLSDERLKTVLRDFSQFDRTETTDQFNLAIVPLKIEEMENYTRALKTNSGRTFTILDLRMIHREIDLYREIGHVGWFHRSHFVVVIFPNEEITVYNRNTVDLSILKEHGAEGHPETGAPHLAMPHTKWEGTDLHRPLTIEEFIEVLIQKI